MDKIKLTLVLVLFAVTVFSQSSDSHAFVNLQRRVEALQTELKNQRVFFQRQLTAAGKDIQQLQSQLRVEKAKIVALTDSLDAKITHSELVAISETSQVEVSETRRTVLRWSLVSVALLLLIQGALFAWLYIYRKKDCYDIIGQFEKYKFDLDEKVAGGLALQTDILGSLKDLALQKGSSPPPAELDHSIPLKLADEITLIERNLSLMEPGIRGVNQIKHSAERLKDNLSAYGYEIPTLLGKRYVEGLNVIVISSVFDESLEKGMEIISKIVKPQVDYKGIMIQAAQIELRVGATKR
ncbi:MAG: hypothetical protein LBH04_03175 [Tannerellaceae bacterium]|nr:hypothetical protein [Tannerellaceae bacterium]